MYNMEFILQGHTGKITCICQPSQYLIVTGSEDNNLIIWDIYTHTPKYFLQGHDDIIMDVCVINSSRVASASIDNSVIIWNIDNGTLLYRYELHTGSVNTLCFIQDMIISGSSDTTLHIWNEHDQDHVLNGHIGPVNIVKQLNPRRIVSGSDDHSLIIWDIPDRAMMYRLRGHTRPVRCICILQLNLFASGSDDSTVKIWTNGGTLNKTLKSHTARINSLCSNQFSNLFSASDDHTIKMWDYETGENINTFNYHSGPVNNIIMYDPATIVSGSDDKTVVAFKIHSNKRIFRGHLDSVSCVFKLMDYRVVSGSRDNNLIIWPEHYFDFTPPLPPPPSEPTFNKNGESLDQTGNVIPNCAICWEIINGNRLEKNIILACGGIFHYKCIQGMTNCPICEKIII